MNKVLFGLAFTALAFFACKNDPNAAQQANATESSDNHASPTLLAGTWVNLDFCSRSSQYGSILGAMNTSHLPFAFAFSFNPEQPDSVVAFNGVEEGKYSVKTRLDTIEIVGALQGKSMYLVYDGSQRENEIILYGVTSAGTAYTDHFIKSKANAKTMNIAFRAALNHHLFSGYFTRSGQKLEKASDGIIFTPGGFMTNFKEYDTYEVCLAGDCFLAGDKMDVIRLSHSKKPGSEKYFGFQFNKTNDVLTFYNLINKNPGEKSAYEVGTPAFSFNRTPAEK